MERDILREKFNPDGSVLRNHQMRMLEILEVIDGICKKHGLTYWLCGGTLIGAIRHQGFIPWDDDIDIEMPEKDYKEFLRICSTDLPEKYKVQNHKTDILYFNTYTKIRDLNSRISEKTKGDRFYKFKGAFVDVFPVTSCNKYLYKLSNHIQKNLLIRPAKYLPFKFFHYCLLPVYHFVIFIYFLFCRIDKLIGSKGISAVYGATFYIPAFDESKVLPVKRSVFEGKNMCVPKDPDYCLRLQYGDYMKIPPLDKIQVHASTIELF